MKQYRCSGRNWACRWTEIAPWYKDSNDNSNTKRAELLKLCKSTIIDLDDAENYLPGNTYSDYINKVETIMGTMPSFFVSGNGIHSYQYCEKWRKIWRWRRCIRRGNQYYYNLNLNLNYNNQLDDYIKQVKTIKDSIPGLVLNNCSNGNTLLDESGMQKCGLRGQLTEQKGWMETYNMVESNKSVMDSIKNTKDFPQYSLANKKNEIINTMYDWEPMNKRSEYNNNYASMRKKDIEARLKVYNNDIPLQYNNCNFTTSSISMNGSEPNCLSKEYNTSFESCGQAYQMSQVFKYGTDDLMKLWTDVSNSIPGNTFGTNKTVLTTSNDSCRKWIDMFNEWQKKEDEAINTPCTPERPITSSNDKVIQALIDKWNETSTKQLEGLNNRMKALKEKIALMPNILELNKDNITSSPPGFPGSVSIKNKPGKVGEIPGQYIEMTIPTGEQGDTGVTGVDGIKGMSGLPGETGKIGPTGIPLIPNYFNYNIKS